MMKCYRYTIAALLFLFFLKPFAGRAQMVGAGREFFMSFMESSLHGFSIVSKHAATVTFHYFANPEQDTTFILVPGEITEFTRGDYFSTASIADHEAGVIDNKSMVICADSNINVIFVNAGAAMADATTIYPVVQPYVIDFDYYTLGVGNLLWGTKNGAVIISHFDGVVLEVTPKYTMGGYPGGEPILVTLNRGETYAIYNLDIDLTGSTIRVVSAPFNNPITVLASTSPLYIYMPLDGEPLCCADAMLEQVLPVVTWDTMYHFVPFMMCADCEELLGAPSLHGLVRVLSAADNNPVYINGSLVGILNTGEHLDTVMDQPAMITSALPVAVAQFVMSSFTSATPEWGDPDQMWLHPVKNGIKESIFEMTANMMPTEFSPVATTLTLIADSSNHEIWLDGTNLDAEFTPYDYNPRYRYLQKLVDNDPQHYLLSEQPVAAYITSLLSFHDGVSYALSDLNGPMVVDSSNNRRWHICVPTVLPGRVGSYDYTWSTEATTSTITVSESGTYWVSHAYGCNTITDTFYITDISLERPLPPDALICPGQPVVVDAYRDYYSGYLWSTGATTPAITVTEPGTYMVKLLTEHCPGIKDTIVFTGPAIPSQPLADSLLCAGQAVTLGQELDPFAYQWSTGATTCCITITEPGTYIRTLINECNEAFVDSSVLQFANCDNCLLVPSAFTPNGDGVNDRFTVVSDCPMGAYRLDIYNRYGQRIFISYDPADGWDGTYNGLPADVGIYFYQVQAHHILKQGALLYEKGDVTLLR